MLTWGVYFYFDESVFAGGVDRLHSDPDRRRRDGGVQGEAVPPLGPVVPVTLRLTLVKRHLGGKPQRRVYKGWGSDWRRAVTNGREAPGGALFNSDICF